MLAWKKLSKIKEKIDLQSLIWFIYFHTTKIEHKEPEIALSIKNKSSKQKLSCGGGWSCNIPPDPCVYTQSVL